MLGHVTGDAAATFEPERGRLFGLAYRLLGSASDAEDIMQDAFLRWASTDRASIAEPATAAWLTTTVTNLAPGAGLAGRPPPGSPAHRACSWPGTGSARKAGSPTARWQAASGPGPVPR